MNAHSLLFLFFFITNLLSCMEFNGVFMPTEIIEKFSYQEEEAPFEQLQKLLLLRCINKYFFEFARKKFNAKVAAEDHILNAYYKQHYLQNNDSSIPKENVFFALALRKDLVFWLFQYLTDENRRIKKIDALVLESWYPLHITAIHNAENAAKLLLKAEPDINMPDAAAKKIPVEYAIEYNNNEVAKILVNAEANAQVIGTLKPDRWHALREMAERNSNQIMHEYIRDVSRLYLDIPEE